MLTTYKLHDFCINQVKSFHYPAKNISIGMKQKRYLGVTKFPPNTCLEIL